MEKCAKKILIIEDSRELAGALEGLLKLRGFTVFTARDGIGGLETARREKPDLVLLDIMLPKISGYEVCRLLKSDSLTWRIPVFVVSSLSKPEQVERAKECGATHFLKKPYDINELVEQVIKLLP